MFLNKGKLLETFGNAPEIIEAYFKNIPEECLDRKRSESVWTIREHLYHLVGVQEMLYQRIMKIKNEEAPVITPHFPENEPDRAELYGSMEKAFSHFKAIRRKQLEVLEQLTESELQKEAAHGEYTRYNIPVLVNHIIFHEYWHMYRIEELWLAKDEHFTE